MSLPRPLAIAVVAALVGALASLISGVPGLRVRPQATGDAALSRSLADLVAGQPGWRDVVAFTLKDGRVAHSSIGTDLINPERPIELGSITKTFTGHLLADAVERREVALHDRLETHLNELQGTPAGSVTLQELATHRSGLPRLLRLSPLAMAAATIGGNPYAAGDPTSLIAGVREAQLKGRGERAYSNVGMALLGHALARAAGAADWPTLARERLFEPLGMKNTVIATTRAQVPGATVPAFHENGLPVEHWWGAAYTPTGSSTYTTASDLARYATALAGGTAPGLKALDQTTEAGTKQSTGLAWFALDGHPRRVWHNGGTGGFSTMLLIDRDARTASFVATNSTQSVDDLGIQLLPDGPHLPTPPSGLSWFVLAQVGAIAALTAGAWRRALRTRDGLDVAGVGSSLGWLVPFVALLGPWSLVPGWVGGLLGGVGVGALVESVLRWRRPGTLGTSGSATTAVSGIAHDVQGSEASDGGAPHPRKNGWRIASVALEGLFLAALAVTFVLR